MKQRQSTTKKKKKNHKIIIQFNWSLISHNLELAWRKHGGHCVIYFMFVREPRSLSPSVQPSPRFPLSLFVLIVLISLGCIFLISILLWLFFTSSSVAYVSAFFCWFFLCNLLSVCSIRLQQQFEIPSIHSAESIQCFFLSGCFALLVAHHTHSHTSAHTRVRQRYTHAEFYSYLPHTWRRAKEKRKTQKSFIIVIWGAAMYQYPCWMAKKAKRKKNKNRTATTMSIIVVDFKSTIKLMRMQNDHILVVFELLCIFVSFIYCCWKKFKWFEVKGEKT